MALFKKVIKSEGGYFHKAHYIGSSRIDFGFCNQFVGRLAITGAVDQQIEAIQWLL